MKLSRMEAQFKALGRPAPRARRYQPSRFFLSSPPTLAHAEICSVPSRRKQKNQNRLDRHPETARIDHVLRLFRERDETGASTIHPAHLMVHSRVVAIGDPQRPLPPSVRSIKAGGTPTPCGPLHSQPGLGALRWPENAKVAGGKPSVALRLGAPVSTLALKLSPSIPEGSRSHRLPSLWPRQSGAK